MKDHTPDKENGSRWRIVRSIDRRQLLVVVVALMCLTALPGASSAAGGGDVRMPSNHTDFGTGDEPAPEVLENFSVGGSGDSASLSGPVGGTTKGGGLVSSGDTISWSESSPSTSESVINVTGVLNNKTVTESGTDAGTKSIDIGGTKAPTNATVSIQIPNEIEGGPGEISEDTSSFTLSDSEPSADYSVDFRLYTDFSPTREYTVYVNGDAVQTNTADNESSYSGDSYFYVHYVSFNQELTAGDNLSISSPDSQTNITQINATAKAEGDTKISTDTGSSVRITDNGTKDISLTGEESSLNITEFGDPIDEWSLEYTAISETVDPVVELNGDSSQQISIDGSVADGQTVTKEIDNSWLESGENTATVTLNDSGLGADDPPMEAKVSVEKPPQSARYVSAAYNNLSRSNGVGIDWSGSGTLDVTVQGWTGSSWEDARQLSTSETGDVVLDYEPIEYDQTRVEIVANDNVEIREESIQFFTSTPEIESATPSSGDAVSESPVELNIDISDADFGTTQGDSVDVTFYDASDDSAIATDTLTANGTANVSWGEIVGGENEWYAVATDSYGNQITSDTFTFNAPSELEIRALDTRELITESPDGSAVNVEVQFYGGETVETRTTTDGTVDLSGLPPDERFAVSIDAGDGYYERQIIIPSLIEQQTAYMLNATDDSISAVRPRFILEDPSNQFDTEESEIIFERPLEMNGSTTYVPVAGDRIGLNGYDAILEEGQRYRVTVRDPASGSERQLGEFTATTSETVTLAVQDVEFDSVSEVSGLEWGAEYITNDEDANGVRFIYRDSIDTESVEYEIVERGNESNVLASGSATGNVTVTETVPPSESDTVWRVSFNATRTTGEELSGSRVVSSSDLPVGDFLPTEWQTAFSVVTLFVVAGLFGGVNPGVGGIAVASTGGFFFLINWLPGRTTGLMVLLAFFIAVLSYGARQARGATA